MHTYDQSTTNMKQTSFKQMLFIGFCLLTMGIWVPNSHATQVGSCRCSGSGITVWPSSKDKAPVNTHVWVRLPAFNPKLNYGKYAFFKKQPKLWATSFALNQLQLELWQGTRSVAGQLLHLQSNQWRMIILQPKGSLQPNAKYEVRLRVGAWVAPIGQFTTQGTAANKPSTSAHAKARLVWSPPTHERCRVDQPFVHLRLAASSIKSAPLVGIWQGGKDGTINYNRPPHLLFSAQKDIFLGRKNQCAENNLALSQAEGTSSFGVRLGSFAGQWGPPQTVFFNKSHPIEPWTWSPTMRVVFWVGLTALFFLLSLLRTWVFQRKSEGLLSDFLSNYTSIKGDAAWIALRKLVEKEKPARLISLLLFIFECFIVLVGGYIFAMSLLDYEVAPHSMTHLLIVVIPLSVFMLLNGLVQFLASWRIRQKRNEIAWFPVASSFQKPCAELLAGWKKKGGQPKPQAEATATAGRPNIQSARK